MPKIAQQSTRKRKSNHNEQSPHTLSKTSVGKDGEFGTFVDIVDIGVNVKWYSCGGKQYDGSSENLNRITLLSRN